MNFSSSMNERLLTGALPVRSPSDHKPNRQQQPSIEPVPVRLYPAQMAYGTVDGRYDSREQMIHLSHHAIPNSIAHMMALAAMPDQKPSFHFELFGSVSVPGNMNRISITAI